MCLPRGGIQFLSVGVMDFPVGARILHPLINFVTASIPPFFSLLLIQGFAPFHKLLDSSLPLSFLPLGNGDKSVYGFCDFLILFLSDTSIHGRCPPANRFR